MTKLQDAALALLSKGKVVRMAEFRRIYKQCGKPLPKYPDRCIASLLRTLDPRHGVVKLSGVGRGHQGRYSIKRK
jgi:hypothetical protein